MICEFLKRHSIPYLDYDIFKRFFKKDLREFGADWVRDNLGAEHVDEYLEKYDKINSGVPIGGFIETAIFLDMIERIKEEWEKL